MHRLELKIPPLALCAVFTIIIVALGYFVPSTNLPFPGHRTASIAALLAGIGIAAAGVVEFRLAKTTVNPLVPSRANSIVATGVYRVSRNPMYLGMAVVLFGAAAWRSTLPGYVLVPLFCLYMTEFQIKPEERVLLAGFGEEFSAYMATVRRWV